MRLFGTDGIRGEVGKYPLTVENILKLAKASSLVLKKKKSQFIIKNNFKKNSVKIRVKEIINNLI